MTTASRDMHAATAVPRPKRVQRQVALIESGRWLAVFYGAAAATAVILPTCSELSPWLGPAIFAIALIFGHQLATAHRTPWLPGLVLLISAVQWIIAPALVYSMPYVPLTIPAAVSSQRYFEVVVPGFLAFAAGLFAPMLRARSGQAQEDAVATMSPADRRRLVNTCKRMAIVGMAAHVLAHGRVPGGISFVVDIVARLTLVGGLCLMLIRAPGWRTWLMAAVLWQVFDSIVSSLFNGLFTQIIHIGLLATFALRVPLRRIGIFVAASFVMLLAINGFKGAYRQGITDLDAGERVNAASQQFWAIVTDPARLFSSSNIAFNISRLNQGSITGRVIYWTPQFEPFANGETVAVALRAAVLPRALDPNKIAAGGGENYPRFTGLPLLNGTSINLSALGEFYANYGEAGSWVALFVWGVFLTSVYRWIYLRARRSSVIWWAWIPFIMPSVLSAESGLVELLNEIFKSGLVMAALLWFIPAWRSLLRRRTPARARAH